VAAHDVSVVVRLNCDQRWRYGSCGSTSWPAKTLDEALTLAGEQGWLVYPDRHLCPTCRPRPPK
jgi:hypothetical protein